MSVLDQSQSEVKVKVKAKPMQFRIIFDTQLKITLYFETILPVGAVAGSCVLLFLQVTHFIAITVICVVGVVYEGFLVCVVDGIGSLRSKSFSKHKRNQFCFQFRKYACCGWCS